jgi:hypothetical protein
MKKATVIVNLGLAALAAGTLVFAAVDNAPRSTMMSAGDYNARMKEIDDERRVSSVVCKRLTGYEKAVCSAELAAENKVRLAELDARYLGTFQSRLSARVTRIDAQFDVDKVRCDAFTGEERNHCVLIATETRNVLISESGSRV